MVVPASGVVHVPLVTLVADPQLIVPGANLTSYLAGAPTPSVTSVKLNVAEVGVTLDTERLLTVPGEAGGGGVVVPAWLRVNVWPAMVIVPLRAVAPVFAVIE